MLDKQMSLGVDKVNSNQIKLRDGITERRTGGKQTDNERMKKDRNKKQGQVDACKMVSAFTRRLNVLNGQLVCLVL